MWAAYVLWQSIFETLVIAYYKTQVALRNVICYDHRDALSAFEFSKTLMTNCHDSVLNVQ